MTLKMTPKDPYLRVLMPKCNYLHFFRSCEQFFVVQSLSCVWLFVTPLTAVCQASLSFTISQSLFKLMSIESVMASNLLVLCHLLLLLPSIFPSIRVFSSESALRIRWPKYWSFSFNISPSNEYSGLISFRIDWFGPFAVQGTLESSPAPQYKIINSLAAFFMVQLSHPYITTGKTIALTIWTFVGKVMSLLFNTLSRFVSFYSKEQASSNFVCSDFGAQENKICHCFHFFPIYLLLTDGTRCHDLRFLNVEFEVSFFTLLFHLHQEAL